MLDSVVYLLYRAGLAIAAALPLWFLFAVGQFLGSCAWLLSGKYRRFAGRNGGFSLLNEKSPREMHRLVRPHFSPSGANLLCRARFAAMPAEGSLRSGQVANIEA